MTDMSTLSTGYASPPSHQPHRGAEAMTTLADMTPEQRAECVGMWATNHNYTGDGENVGVIACVQHDCVWLIHTCLHGEWSVFSVGSVSPRPDLPRAWNPDGTPPRGEWETDTDYLISIDGEIASTRTVSRWVGEWTGEWEPTE